MERIAVLTLVASLWGDLGTFLFEVLTTIVPPCRVDDFPGLAAGIHLLVGSFAVFSVHLRASTYSETTNHTRSISGLSMPSMSQNAPCSLLWNIFGLSLDIGSHE